MCKIANTCQPQCPCVDGGYGCVYVCNCGRCMKGFDEVRPCPQILQQVQDDRDRMAEMEESVYDPQDD